MVNGHRSTNSSGPLNDISMYNFIFIFLTMYTDTIIVAEIWREYVGVEGLDLTPQLVIANKNLEETEATLLVDKNVTTCVEVIYNGNKGNLLV